MIPKIKYEKSGLDEEKADKIYQQLVGCMHTQKLFTDSELTLGVLAKNLEIHPNHLSQVVNSYEGKNFYDYINSQRVEEFKKLAPQPANRNYTLLSLAYECGFNSKTSFNRNFKKATGVSPSEWLQKQDISLKQES
jgi:YesN/AraC family two-component response regulator